MKGDMVLATEGGDLTLVIRWNASVIKVTECSHSDEFEVGKPSASQE